ncbi:MAG: hypothetical protein NTZ05_10655 [Chloroflexi bacterium]|nr:hypothetical protein [Chloroflexota bacterium]
MREQLPRFLDAGELAVMYEIPTWDVLVATHEAGHAVAALAQGRPGLLIDVSVAPDQRSAHAWGMTRLQPFRPDVRAALRARVDGCGGALSPEQTTEVEAALVGLLAGDKAALRLLNLGAETAQREMNRADLEPRVLAMMMQSVRTDQEIAVNLAALAFDDRMILEWASVRADDLVQANLETVRALVGALLVNGTHSGRRSGGGGGNDGD